MHDFLQNLNGPVIFANDVLQGQLRLAGQTLARLAINTTVGVGGMFDVASAVGIPHHTNDLGHHSGDLGHSRRPLCHRRRCSARTNPRDIVGQVGRQLRRPRQLRRRPASVWYASLARTAVSGIDVRSRNIEALADIEKTSLDYYATIRSLYRQRRAAQIRHENPNLPNPTLCRAATARQSPRCSPFVRQLASTFEEVSAR